MIYLIIGVYLFITLLTGFIGYNQSKNTAEDYFLGSRGFGILIMFFTFIATNFSAFFFLGFPGEGYRTGFSYYPMMAFGTALAAVSFFVIGIKTWKLGQTKSYVTAPELIGGETQSPPLKIVYLLVMVFFTLPYMAVQPIGAGIIINELTHGEVPYFVGCALLMFFIVVYVFVGGMRSIAITDMIQGILMFSLMFAALILVVQYLGGISKANAEVYDKFPALFSREGANGSFTEKKWFSMILLWLFCVPMFPQMFMRFFISKDLKTLKQSAVLYALVPTILFLPPVLIGMYGHLVYPDLLSEAASPKVADKILPMLMNNPEIASPAFAAIIMTGALAAFMSTLDSQLLALSTMLTRDVFFSKKENETAAKDGFKNQVWISRLIIIILALIALSIAYFKPSSIFAIVKMAFTGLALLFPVTFAVLHWKRTHPTAAIASILSAETLYICLSLGWLPKSITFGFDALIPCLLVAVFVLVGGSLLFPKKELNHPILE